MREWLKGRDEAERQAIGRDLLRAQWRWPVGISKNKLATLVNTSRSQVDRLLDPKNDITLGSLQKAAAMVGCRVNIELV